MMAMTQDQMAGKLGVSQSFISRMKNGYIRPTKLRAESWFPLTGWTWEKWQKATQAQIQKLLDRIGAENAHEQA